ncbi:hypothetical protein LAZ67_7000625 [Cordylochernes scorpioides]|uniref:Transposase n=1 Tax=Cordylochernes scorpioides TaxID=51811 RepID=A0ABY6KQ87_9ARAC|nr:hypothetical protein LAZ67_7000625 [Cordylochernes scorpioides]
MTLWAKALIEKEQQLGEKMCDRFLAKETVGQPPEPVVKHKSLLCNLWDFERIIHYKFIPKGQTIIDNEYYELQEQLYTFMKQKYLALVNRNRILIQLDSAIAHTA